MKPTTDRLFDHEEVEKEVREHLHDERKNYTQLVRTLCDLMREYQRTSDGQRAVYRITTREDYPPNTSPLKSDRSIADKIIGKRETQRKNKKQVKYGVLQVDDIAALRIVCVYPSDVKSVRKHIQKLSTEGRIRTRSRFETKKHRSGYRAVHVTVSLTEPTVSSLLCEIQLVTMLQEAWGLKVHPLIYKGENVDSGHQQETSFLSDLLSDIDRHSEVIKTRIFDRALREEEERVALIRTHLVKLFNGVADKALSEELASRISNEKLDFEALDRNNALELLKDFVRRRRENLLVARDMDLAANLIWDKADEFRERYTPFRSCESESDFTLCLQLCRIYALSAMCESTGKFRESIRRFARTLRDVASSQVQSRIAQAYTYEGWVHFCLGGPESAIDRTRQAIEEGSRQQQWRVVQAAQNNFAYFAAAFLDRERRRVRKRLSVQERESIMEEAELLIQGQLTRMKQQRLPETQLSMREMQLQDTLGFLKIAGGKTGKQVEKGLELCRRLLTANLDPSDPLTPVARAYAKKHVRKGRERLLELYMKRSR